MSSLSEIRKKITQLFNWTSKPQQSQQKQTNSQKIQSKSQKPNKIKIIKSQTKTINPTQTPHPQNLNQRKQHLYGQQVFNYIKNILIQQQIDCPICLTKYKKPGLIKFSQCQHYYCNSCLKAYVIQRLHTFNVVKCPNQTCQHLLNKDSSFYKSLNNNQQKLTNKIQKFHLTSNDPYLRMCPTQNCQGIIPVIEGQQLKCPLCHNQYCKKCMYYKHNGKCTKNQISYLNEKYRYRKCGRCGIIVQKTQACNHITCKCGYQFCYGCGRKWPGNGHHCNVYRANRPQTANNNRSTQNIQPQSLIMKCLRIMGQILMTIVLLCGVAFYSTVCLLPMMIGTLICGFLIGISIYSIKFIYHTCKNESPQLGFLLIILFPVAMCVGVYQGFKDFWWDGFLFWWEILRQAIQKPLALIWNN